MVVLFAQLRSVYKNLVTPQHVYDEQRDARNYQGPLPVVAHPPCRAWGRFKGIAKPAPGEKDLALFAVNMVRNWGGVLEHPAASSLWDVAGLPHPRGLHRDAYGGFTVAVHQSWFGHRAPKLTWLYIVGVDPVNVPPLPLTLGLPPGRVELMDRPEREATPPAFATWLLELASRCNPPRFA